MPDLARKTIGGAARGRAGLPGGCLLVFALPFFAGGVALALAGFGVIDWMKGSSLESDRVVLPAVGGALFLAGLSTFWKGARDVARSARRRRLLAERPGEPWLADCPWNLAESRDESPRKARRTLATAFILLAVGGLTTAAAFLTTGAKPSAYAIAGVLDLVAISVLLYAIVLFGRLSKFGVARLRFAQFPFFLGERLDAGLSCARLSEVAPLLRLTLRCVQEHIEVRRYGRHRKRVIVRDQVWAETAGIDPRALSLAAGGEVPVYFPLPPAALSTNFSTREPRYWEIEAHAPLPGLDFRAAFLVPVYARPGTAAPGMPSGA